MGIRELESRILKDARAEANAIAERAARVRDKILEDADAEAEALYQSRFAELKSAAEEEKKQRLTLQALDARRGVLEEKRAQLRRVFDAALDELKNLPADRYRDLLVGMLVEAASEGAGEVMLSDRDRRSVGRELVEAANRELADRGKTPGLSLSDETRDISGGFVLRTGDVEVNSSFASEMQSMRDELEEKLVDMLFGGNSFSGA
jgi:V/A-type H+/Na+-transporting ATPase subunit E